MSLSVKNAIQSALKTYLTTTLTGTSVISLRDNTEMRKAAAVYVYVSPEENFDGNANIFVMDVEFHAVTYISDDKNHAALDALYNNLLGIANGLVKKTITITSSGLSIDAFTMAQKGEDNFPIDEHFQAEIIRLQVYVSK